MDEATEVPAEFIKARMHDRNKCEVCGPYVNNPAYKQGVELAIAHGKIK